ncbi:hypothetical protein DFH08DRAFT_930879 [Mycena albidolilacea]|uniref:Uncharacterized protein n=1 Tax=Mycena albidolilacea TaxID=1033008 RepID=A0AAD7AM67_9AGAR|nr:hypothetical protein DFH08DRAFT_930879 [Mycena albidolilacea]
MRVDSSRIRFNKIFIGTRNEGGVGRTEERRWLRWSDRTENRWSEESLEKIQEHMGCKSAGIGRVLSVLHKAAEQQQRSSLSLNCEPVTGLKSDAQRYGESGVKYQGRLEPRGREGIERGESVKSVAQALQARIYRPQGGQGTLVCGTKDGHGYTRGYLRAYPYPDQPRPYPYTGRV